MAHLRALAVLICCAFSGHAPCAAADTLRVGGMGAATEMLRHLASVYAGHGGDRIEVIPGLGSIGALQATADGVLALTISGRPLTPAETAKGLIALGQFRSPFIFVSSRREAGNLESAQIPRLYSDEKATWADGTPLSVIMRPRSDTDFTLLAGLLPGMQTSLELARRRSDLPVAATDQDNLDLAERLPGSLTGAILMQIATESRNLRVLSIDGVEPSLVNFASGAYRFGKTLHLVVQAPMRPGVQSFIDFVKSPTGRQILCDSGNLPLED